MEAFFTGISPVLVCQTVPVGGKHLLKDNTKVHGHFTFFGSYLSFLHSAVHKVYRLPHINHSKSLDNVTILQTYLCPKLPNYQSDQQY